MDKRAKGNRYYKKVEKWLQEQGYTVVKTENTKIAWIGGRLIPIRTDMLASDGFALNDTEAFLFQVKSHATHVWDAKEAYKKVPNGIRKVIYLWLPRAKQPKIYE